jgi:hypothetical protein
MRWVAAAVLVVAAAQAEAAFDDEVEFEVSGRVFARAQADERHEFERRLSLPAARAQLSASFGIARAVLEADIASSSLVKDAYVRLSPLDDRARVYAGQFKAPFLGRAMESRWDLPLVSRGFVEEYLVTTNGMAGRRIGLLGEARPGLPGKPRLAVGAFQGGRDELGRRLGEDVSVRLGARPWKRLELAVSGYQADVVGARERRAAGAEGTLQLGNVQVSAEALAGRLPVGDFSAQLLLARWLVPLDEVWALEPLLGGEGLQVWGEGGGSGRNFVTGVNVHYGSRLKLMVQGERGRLPGDDGMRNRFMVQLAARL